MKKSCHGNLLSHDGDTDARVLKLPAMSSGEARKPP